MNARKPLRFLAGVVAVLGVLAFAGTAQAVCDGDDNGDNVVDVQDLTRVILNWGTAGPDGDCDGSGTVDVADLTMVVLNWGPCP